MASDEDEITVGADGKISRASSVRTVPPESARTGDRSSGKSVRGDGQTRQPSKITGREVSDIMDLTGTKGEKSSNNSAGKSSKAAENGSKQVAVLDNETIKVLTNALRKNTEDATRALNEVQALKESSGAGGPYVEDQLNRLWATASSHDKQFGLVMVDMGKLKDYIDKQTEDLRKQIAELKGKLVAAPSAPAPTYVSVMTPAVATPAPVSPTPPVLAPAPVVTALAAPVAAPAPAPVAAPAPAPVAAPAPAPVAAPVASPNPQASPAPVTNPPLVRPVAASPQLTPVSQPPPQLVQQSPPVAANILNLVRPGTQNQQVRFQAQPTFQLNPVANPSPALFQAAPLSGPPAPLSKQTQPSTSLPVIESPTQEPAPASHTASYADTKCGTVSLTPNGALAVDIEVVGPGYISLCPGSFVNLKVPFSFLQQVGTQSYNIPVELNGSKYTMKIPELPEYGFRINRAFPLT